MNKSVKTVIRYVLAMWQEQRYREMKTRLETLLELLDMLEEKGHGFYADEVIETICWHEPKEPEDWVNASTL